MNTYPRSHQYGADRQADIAVENSELAHEDSRAEIAAIEALGARIEAAIDRQTAAIIAALLPHMQTNPHVEPKNEPVQFVQSVDKGEMDSITPVVIDGQTYTSPKLMQVIKWLEVNPTMREKTVREIADMTGVSKSWVAMAKKYQP